MVPALGMLGRVIYRLALLGSRALMAAAAHVRAGDLAVLDRPGPYILAVNHLSSWDVPLIFSRTPAHRRMVVLAADKWRRVLPIRWLFDAVGCVWVKRGEVDRAALNAVLAQLRRGRVVGIAPEGTRSKTGALQRARHGAGWLARMSGTPVIPMALWGVERIGPGRRPEVFVRAGEPLALPREASNDEATERIMRAIAALLPESYRGAYR